MSRRLWMRSLWLLGACVALAQVRMPAQESAFVPRPLTLREGEIIVNAVWERERQTDRRPDCSHLVHEVYTLAGYAYPYADSFDLYAGVHSFVRVAKPQPGDLVVWRGHVGIVVNPAERSFYRLDRKVIVYSSLSVDRTEFKGKRGSAQARIKSQVILLAESIERKPHYEKFRWELRRVNGGWEVLVPKDRVYVPRDVAVRMLAARLASLAQDSGVSGSDSSLRQQAQIVRALSALFEEGL